MLRSIALSAALAFGFAISANAGVAPGPIGGGQSLIVKVAESCGAGWWRGANGKCHPMAANHVCPAGYHLGPDGQRCWPN